MNCSWYFSFKFLTFSATPEAGLFTTIHIVHGHFILFTWHPSLGGGPVCNGTLVIPWKEEYILHICLFFYTIHTTMKAEYSTKSQKF